MLRQGKSRPGLSRGVRVAAAAAVVLGANAVFMTSVQAVPLIIDVTSTADTHTPGTLRDAFDQANAGVFDAVTINLPAGTYDLVLCGADDDDNATGDLDSTQNAPVTIIGQGGVATINQTCSDTRVVDQLGTGLLSLTNTTLTGGNAVGVGGAVRAAGSVTVTGASFTGNQSHGPNGSNQVCPATPGTAGGPGAGGAIAASGDVTVTDSTFSGNEATGGTGGKLFVFTCPPLGSSQGGTGQGGAIWAGGRIDVFGGTLSANTARGGDGGVDAEGLGVVSTGGDGEGGALWSQTGLAIDGATITDNRALAGRASGSARGGAALSGDAATVTSSTITGNQASGSDGQRHPCVPAPGGAASGGGLMSGGALSITGSTLSSNAATGAFGGSANTGVCPSGFPGQPAGPGYGGGALSQQGAVTIQGSTVSQNRATAGAAGVSFGDFGETLAVATGANASGAGAQAGTALTVAGSTITDNISTGGQGAPGGFSYGGGAFASTTAAVTQSTVGGNQAVAGTGWVDNVGPFEAPGGQSAGGGIWANEAATIGASTFAGNHADGGPSGPHNEGFGEGGAIGSVAPITATNSTFDANVANHTPAGAAISGSEVDLLYVTLTNNVGSTALSGSTFRPSRTVMAGQVTGSLCGFGDTQSGGYNWADDASCALNDPTDVENGTDPMLAALADNGGPTWTRLPLVGSPLIDAIPAASCQIALDQRGLPRPGATGCDIGSVELQPVPVTTTTTSTTTTSTTEPPSSTTTSTTTEPPSSTTTTGGPGVLAASANPAPPSGVRTLTGSLPVTGVDPGGLVLLALTALGAGGAILVAGRRRRAG